MAAIGYTKVGLIVTLLALPTACADGPDSSRATAAPASPTESDGLQAEAEGTSPNRVRVAVPSHCGVLSVTVDGHLWLAAPPLGDHNPPPGWDENETTGVLIKTGPRRAVFKGDGGQRAFFRRAPLDAENPNAGCE